MALKTLVKVGEISNLSDARYCAGMGVEMLGFNLNKQSDTFVSPEQFKEITDWVAGVKFVGEFTDADVETIKQFISVYAVDMVQITDTNSEVIFDLDLPVIMHIKSSDLEELELLMSQVGNQVDYYLLENFDDPDELKELADNYPILVGCNIDVENVHLWIEETAIKGVALKGSLEEKPGFKDYDQLADILEALETDD